LAKLHRLKKIKKIDKFIKLKLKQKFETGPWQLATDLDALAPWSMAILRLQTIDVVFN
jgi:hypothetical protein